MTQIIFCTDGIFPYMVGGIQRHSRLLAESLAKSGKVELIVIHPHQGKTVFDPELGIKEIIPDPEISSGTYLLDCYRYSAKVIKIIRQYPDAVVYAQGLTVWAEIGSISDRLILNPHGLEPFQGISFKDKLIGLLFRIIMRYQFKKAKYVVSLGGHLTGIIEKIVNPGTTIVMPNAVNIPYPVTRNYNSQVMKFLFVGRFAFNKGIDILTKAIKELNEEGYESKTEFNLVGKGPLFEEYANSFHFPNLNYLGFASDDELIELYKNNDVFVFPTLFEGMPTVVLEAMSFGMPVIVTDTGATTELVDESNGIIINKKDVSSLKKAIRTFVQSNEQYRRKLSDASYEKVKHRFSWLLVAEMHCDLFEKVKNQMAGNA